MGFFSPYKRHANQFSYTPRYYDPEKEAREQRRAELRGERSDDTGEYTPGKYIRTQSEARQQSRAKRKSNVLGGSTRIISLVVVMLLVFLFVYVLVPRVGAIFEMATTDSATKQYERQQQEVDEFDPYAPLIIVPNDYQEGDEIEIIEE